MSEKGGREARQPRPNIELMLKAALEESQKITNALSSGVNDFLRSDINIHRLSCILGDIDTLQNSKPNVPIMRAEEYRHIVDSTAIVSKTDVSGVITYANEEFCRISGYTIGELIGQKHSLVRHPDTPDEVSAELWETISIRKTIWKGRLKNRSKDKKDYYVDARIVPQIDPYGKILGYVAICYDITESALQKEVFDHERELNKLILDEQPNIVAVIAKDDGVARLNKAFFDMFGYKDLEDFNREHSCIFELFTSSDDECAISQSKWWLDFVANNAHGIERRIKAVDIFGVTRTFEINAKSIGIGEGLYHQEYYIVSLGDITLSQNEADNAKKEATEAHRESYAKSSFLANMSHEIRTPLNGIIPVVKLLEETLLDAVQKEQIAIIERSATSLLQIINDILDFSKIETGAFEIETIDFDLVEELESITDLFVAKANEKGIGFCVFIDPKIPTCVLGDPLRIKQVVNNLVGNAIKFTNEGEVNVVAEYQCDFDNEATVRVSIKDTGLGIKKEDMSDIFNPFTQADNTITRKFGGTGLGLSICKNLVEKMGGELMVDSQYGSGSEFYFDLSLQKCNCSKSRISLNTDHKMIGIYIVDDYKARRCSETLFRYLDAFNLNYAEIHNRDEVEIASCDILIIVSTGNDTIDWVDEQFIKDIRVVSIVPANIKSRNRYKFTTAISMPINGSKIYDAILDIRHSPTRDIEAFLVDGASSSTYDARVLVAEDNKTNQVVAKAILNRFGIEPIIVENGVEAIEMVKDMFYRGGQRFDLIFMDIHMPVLNGVEATKEILAHEAHFNIKHTPIIALTADAIKGREQEYLACGMDGFVSKPIDRIKFDEAINTFLGHLRNENDVIESADDVDIKKAFSVGKITQNIAENLGIDEDNAKMLLDNFYANWNDYETRLNMAVEQNDIEEIRSVSHAIKGASGSVCLEDVQKLSERIEQHAAIGETVDYHTLIAELKSLVSSSRV